MAWRMRVSFFLLPILAVACDTAAPQQLGDILATGKVPHLPGQLAIGMSKDDATHALPWLTFEEKNGAARASAGRDRITLDFDAAGGLRDVTGTIDSSEVPRFTDAWGPPQTAAGDNELMRVWLDPETRTRAVVTDEGSRTFSFSIGPYLTADELLEAAPSYLRVRAGDLPGRYPGIEIGTGKATRTQPPLPFSDENTRVHLTLDDGMVASVGITAHDGGNADERQRVMARIDNLRSHPNLLVEAEEHDDDVVVAVLPR